MNQQLAERSVNAARSLTPEQARNLEIPDSMVDRIADMTDRQIRVLEERELVALFLQEPIWRTRQDISEDLGISKSYAGNLLASVTDEKDLESPVIDDRGTGGFKCPKTPVNS
jgi:hypothetical protein